MEDTFAQQQESIPSSISKSRTDLITSATLLNKAVQLLVKRRQGTRESIELLIEKCRPRIEQMIVTNQKTAPFFNVFEALGVTRKEVIQSRFIAYLLSPQEHHNQKAKFLNAFLSIIGGPEINNEEAKKVRVTTEHNAGEALGRMDIVIRYEPDWLIVIENKIDAGEGENQLSRYNQWLKQQRYSNKRLVFLTPMGNESATGAVGSYCPLSYLALAKAFEEVTEPKDEVPKTVLAVIEQYISTCFSIGGINMVKMDFELQKLLTGTDENIRAALEIEQQTALARINIAKVFVENIAEILSARVSTDSGIGKTWIVISRTDSDGSAHVEIRTRRHSNLKPNYKLVGEYVFTRGGQGWCGWYRPKSVDLNQHQETTALTEKMREDNFDGGAESWWIASNNFRGGKQGYVLSNIDDIVDCWKDNRDEDHPLAKEIAEEMWKMFAYRADIEQLESFKQATS